MPARTPLYHQLAAAMREGTLRPGGRLPSVRRLAERHRVSLSTAT